MLFHQLTKVLVWGHHINVEIFVLGFFGDGADNVVRFVPVQLQNRDFESGDDLLDPRNGNFYVFWLCLPVGFIGGILLMPESRSTGIKGHRDVGRLFFFQNLQQRIGKTEHHPGIQPFAVDSGVFAKGKMSSINKSHGIQKK